MTIETERSGLALIARRAALALLATAVAAMAAPAGAETLMLEEPSAAAGRLAFVYAGDIWVAGLDGSAPARLTSHPASEGQPALSPDGRWVAFSAQYQGNSDVYVIPSEGGPPKRLTWHPSNDTVRGWTADGKAVLFMSNREVMSRGGDQLFTVALEGGLPVALPMPQAADGAFSADGKRIAYQLFTPAQYGPSGWDHYRGGRTPPIWIFDMASHAIERIPHDRVNDTNPVWVGDTIYFLSDRSGKVNVFSYDTSRRTVTQLTRHDDWDVEGLTASDGAVIYGAGGRLYRLDPARGEGRPLPIALKADLPQLQPQWKDASKMITGSGLSPTGARAVFAARGDIFTVPLEHGDTRNLTRSSGTHDRDPLWSPDGRSVAWVSDENDRFELIIADQSGAGEKRSISLGDDTYYFLRGWSPDGGFIIYEDAHLGLHLLDVEKGTHRLIDTSTRRLFGRSFEAAFSPDGRWVAYVKALPNYLRSLFLYDVGSGRSHQVTDGLAEVSSPAFSRDGKYLYIAASTNFGNRTIGLDMTTQDRPVRSGLYAVVLAADGTSPLPPESDEEKPDSKKGDGSKAEGEKTEKAEGEEASKAGKDGSDAKTHVEVKVGLEGLAGRIVALPVAEKDYGNLRVGKDGSLFYLDRRQAGASNDPPGSEEEAVNALMRFDFKERKEEIFLDAVAAFDICGDGTKMLVQGPRQGWSVAGTDKKPTGRGEAVKLEGLKARVDPRAEWEHIFHDAWRMERDYFYAPNMHGLDWAGVEKKYAPLVSHLGRREDLNSIIIDMIAELQVGHNRVFTGDVYRPEPVPVGLLGADYEINDGKYRIRRLLTAESWNPFVQAPLAVPGLGISVGDYILAVDGRELTAKDSILSFFENTVGKQVVLRVTPGSDPDKGRDVTVVPIAEDRELRLRNWVEQNRRRVEEATDGRVGYVYLPNTAGDGFDYFNRYFFSQVDKEAFVIDERFNGGGQAANYITETLGRPWLSSWKDRDGLLFTTPAGVVPGPKVMLINESSGSGGDFLPWSFRHLGLGPLVGTRTWGGLIGISTNPLFIDGGRLTVPYFRYLDPAGKWSIENEGVPPDIEVEQLPEEVIEGKDPQLERAIAEMLTALKGYTSPIPKEPPPLPKELGR